MLKIITLEKLISGWMGDHQLTPISVCFSAFGSGTDGVGGYWGMNYGTR